MATQTKKITIRKAAIKDLDGVLKLNTLLLHNEFKHDATIDLNWANSKHAKAFIIERLIKDADGVIFIALDNTEMLGYIAGGLVEVAPYRKVKKIAEIEELFVLESYRGQKIGKKLLENFLKWSEAIHAEKISIRVSATNKNTIGFYKKLGFNDYDVILER